MKQGTVAGKICVELLELGIIKEDHELAMYNYLMQAYAAGWVEGTKQKSNKKQVLQLTLDGKPLAVHDSTLVAERKTGVANQAISACASGKKGNYTAGGYRWAYVQHKKPTSEGEPTVGSSQGKQSAPK